MNVRKSGTQKNSQPETNNTNYELEKEKKANEKKTSQLNQEIASLRTLCTEYNQKNAKLTQQIEELNKEIEAITKQVRLSEDKNKTGIEKIESLSLQLKTLTTTSEDNVTFYKSFVRDLESQIENAEKIISEQKKELSEKSLDPSANSLLLMHAQAGNLKKVEAALTLEAKLNTKNETGHIPLHLSLLNEHYHVAKFLLASVGELNENTSEDYQKVLEFFSTKGNLGTTKFILDHFPKINNMNIFVSAHKVAATAEIKQEIANSLLLQGVKQNNIRMMEKSVELGADVNLNSGEPLRNAYHYTNPEAVDFLLAKFCRVSKSIGEFPENPEIKEDGKITEEEIETKAKEKKIQDSLSNHQKKENLANLIQPSVRGFFARKEYDQLKIEKEAQLQINTKAKQLVDEGKIDESVSLLKQLQELGPVKTLELISKNIPSKSMGLN